MDDSASQMMNDVEVGWDCGSPTPTAWKRYQMPNSGDYATQRKMTPEYKFKPKKPKIIHNEDNNVKSYEIARKLISDLTKFKHNNNENIHNSMDLVFEMSGQGEDLDSPLATLEDTEPILDIPVMDDSGLSDDDLFDDSFIRHADEIMKAYKSPNRPVNKTSTPMQDQSVNRVKPVNQRMPVNHIESKSAIKHLKPKVLKNKLS
uniref:Uncharacterized protein n=1 Tax=Ciona savignyi TaxID=51511 RepID=H2YY52_CIOSA